MQVNDKQVRLTKQLMGYLEAQGISRRRFVKLLGTTGGGMMLSSLIAACGGDGNGGSDTSATSSTTGSGSTSGGATPTAGGESSPTTGDSNGGTAATPRVLVALSEQDISNLDPHIGHDYSIATAQKSVYDSLVRYQGNPPELENLLAKSYESNDDASEWTFVLDERATFHDGSPVKASDVVYSFQRMLRKNKGVAWMFVKIMTENGPTVVDDHTVKLTLTIPFAPLPLILPWLFVVNEALVKQHEVDGDEGEAWLLDHEAGSGPFTIKRWQVGDSYEFEAVPDYWWGWPKEGRLAGFVWKISRESSSSRLMLLNGDAQIGYNLSSEDADALAKEGSLTVNDELSLTVFAVDLNNQVGPTSDVNVRKALSYAMDYDAIIKIFNGHAVLLEGPLPKGLGEYVNPNLDIYRHNMDKAKAALAAADPQYSSGGFELEYVYVTGLQWEEQIGLILLDQLSQLDIKVKMTPMVWPDMVARAKDQNTAPAMFAVQSGTDYADPDNFLWQAYHSSQAGFWSAAAHYKNPDFDKVLEDARATADHNQRVQLYYRAQEILVADAPVIWGQNPKSRLVLSKKVGGYSYCPIMGTHFQPLWMKD